MRIESVDGIRIESADGVESVDGTYKYAQACYVGVCGGKVSWIECRENVTRGHIREVARSERHEAIDTKRETRSERHERQRKRETIEAP